MRSDRVKPKYRQLCEITREIFIYLFILISNNRLIYVTD